MSHLSSAFGRVVAAKVSQNREAKGTGFGLFWDRSGERQLSQTHVLAWMEICFQAVGCMMYKLGR